MKLARSFEGLRAALRAERAAGFVPTMGALHEGHLTLMRRARSDGGLVVASIFVNPLQFGPGEDFKRYPRDLERDLSLCAIAGVDLVLVPESAAMYPAGFATSVDVGRLGEVLEGRIRPGHFRGVATVVLKLLNLVRPERAYFGQKDYQQTVVIRRMVEDLSVACRIEVVPTVRETDGLAMSSRNVYLGPAERKEAGALFQALRAMAALAEGGEKDVSRLRAGGQAVLETAPLVQPEYLEVCTADRLEPLDRVEGQVVALVAGRLGSTRLIDNLPLPPPQG